MNYMCLQSETLGTFLHGSGDLISASQHMAHCEEVSPREGAGAGGPGC